MPRARSGQRRARAGSRRCAPLAQLLAGGRASGATTALVLGARGGFWSRTVRAEISPRIAPPGSGRARPRTLLLTQGTVLAERVLVAAARRGVPIDAAVSSGPRGGTSWCALAGLACALPARPRLLIALHLPPSLAELIGLASLAPDALLLVTGSADPLLGVPAPEGCPVPSTSALARGLGLAVTRTPGELVAAVALLEGGISPRSGVIRASSESAEEAALLEDALSRCRLQAPPARGKPDALVAIRDDGFAVAAPAARPRWIPGGEELLCALASLLDRPAAGAPGRAASSRHARALLDAWPAALGEVAVKQLLGCYGVRAAEERLVLSASAAGRAARELGLPVAVKATGPTLRERRGRGALLLPVGSVSAARQAFRDVLHACAELRPPPILDGVLVSRVVPAPAALDLTLLWPEDAPPVLIAARQGATAGALALTCPPSAAQAAWLVRRLLGDGITGERRLGQLLARLGGVAPDLAGRMRWLRLDTVTAGTAAAPLLVDGWGLQTSSWRDPLGLHASAETAPAEPAPRTRS